MNNRRESSSLSPSAKPECALGLVECGVKSIDKIEVICLSFRCCSAERIEWRQPFYDFLNEFNLVEEIKFRYLLLDTVNLNGGN